MTLYTDDILITDIKGLYPKIDILRGGWDFIKKNPQHREEGL